ncbi:hypothetical protein BUALT_Bualt14G0005800 [Buddleja alternifolia]|uniref:UBC core domain-containing protein n=1 Tax=Buddleja alternifolia TaxID=168488 RepID=A0AAV6WDS2_9LAMI|nr:hypothetical protein BUALT_Bualt14G0005800 [Buddleja alternifolia]
MVNFWKKIYHLIISITGGLEIDILRERCQPALTIPQVLEKIRQLLAQPKVDAPHPRSTEALTMYLEDQDRYIRTAKAWTVEYVDVWAGEF